MSDDLTPLPRRVQWWRETAKQRQRALKTFGTMAAKASVLAFSALGATLISFGVYQVYAPAGYVVGGILVWALQWSHEQDKRRSE
jgi:hypothetical protein